MKTYIVIQKFADRLNRFNIVDVGEHHTPHNEERAKLLLDGGFLGEEVLIPKPTGDESVVIEREEATSGETSDDYELITHPGGVYELPNGDRVKGKAKALKALEELRGSDGDESGEVKPASDLPE